MNKAIKRIWLGAMFIPLIIILTAMSPNPQDELQKEVSEYAEENEANCLRCHGGNTYSFENEWTEETDTRIMNPYYRINEEEFYQSNHYNFRCIDCHSSDYESFPHDGELRMEPAYTCMDCHEGDDDYAHFKFEVIAEEFEKSVHYEGYEFTFSCWKCHDPHAYKTMARSNSSILDIVDVSNKMCLECHNGGDKYTVMKDEEMLDMAESHNWLPNQGQHFKKVRCLECHVPVSEELLVGHNILPKDQAVRECVKCHSSNSLLMATLYKHNNIENRKNAGFINAVILNESYVIGANRNYILNVISILAFGLTLLIIVFHIILRIRSKKS